MADPAPIVVRLDDAREAGDRPPVSPLIFGTNHDVAGVGRWPLIRAGGNRFTGYNFANDASNAGRDTRHQSDHWLTTRWSDPHPPFALDNNADLPQPGTPLAALRCVQRAAIQHDAAAIWTLPIAGHVAADADGPVTEDQTAPSPRWVVPDTVAMIHAIRAMDEAAGRDATQRLYSLDNEPGLWAETHPRLHPEKVSVDELIQRSLHEARHIKQLDPDATVVGPALWGMPAFVHLHEAPDALNQAQRERGPYRWFIDRYLDAFRLASEEDGVRLLDVLDVHWYPQIREDPAVTPTQIANAARGFYDPTYTDPTWVGQYFGDFLPLLPRLQQSIDAFFPGTGLGVSEYDWPDQDRIETGLAQADALGAFADAGLALACYHPFRLDQVGRFVGAAFSLFGRSADDAAPPAFAGRVQPIAPFDSRRLSVYATRDDAGLHVVLIHRAETPTPLDLTPLFAGATARRAWLLDASAAAVQPIGPPPSPALTLPARAALRLLVN